MRLIQRISGLRALASQFEKATRRLWSGGPLAACLLLAACGAGLPSDGGSGTDDPPTYSSGGPPSYFAQGPNAPFKTAYRGTRLVELYYDAQAPVVYREDVGANGKNKFSVETLDVLVTSKPDTALFILMQDMRQTQIYRHRDFRIRDLGLFLSNYDFLVIPNSTNVAGVACDRVQVQARTAALSRFEVDIDPMTGLVMAWEEYDLSAGTLLARVAFETYTPYGDLSDMVLVDHVFQTTSYAVQSEGFEQALGFTPLIPQLQPGAGYQLAPMGEVLAVNDAKWAKLYLTDGMASCVFMHTRQPTPQVGGSGLAEKKGEVAVMQVGSWSSLRGTVNGHTVIMAGRVSEMNLATVLDSALR